MKLIVIRLTSDRSSATAFVCNARTSAREDAMRSRSAESYFGECLSSTNIHTKPERTGTRFRFSSTVPPKRTTMFTGRRRTSFHFKSASYRRSAAWVRLFCVSNQRFDYLLEFGPPSHLANATAVYPTKAPRSSRYHVNPCVKVISIAPKNAMPR